MQLLPRHWPRNFKSKPIPRRQRTELMQRHDGIIEPNDYQNAHVLIGGAGGLASPIAIGLVNKGVRELTVVDPDFVELTNCNRTVFGAKHVGKNKAIELGRICAREALMPLTVHSYPLYWQEYVETVDQVPRFDLMICLPDNNPTRRAMSLWAHQHQTPLITAAVGRDANAANVTCQVPGGACWGCTVPQYVNDDSFPCGTPAIVDVLNIASGFVLAAADSLISTRPREWNFRAVFMDGGLPDRTQLIERRTDCPICSTPVAA